MLHIPICLLNNRTANIGDALLKHTDLSPIAIRKDLRSVGLIMVELMEQTTSALNPDDLKVTNPNAWNDCPTILSFLADTATHSLDELLGHEFLSHAGNSNSFATWALIAQFNAYTPITLLP